MWAQSWAWKYVWAHCSYNREPLHRGPAVTANMMISLRPGAKDDDPADTENTDIDTDGGNLDTDVQDTDVHETDDNTCDADIDENCGQISYSFFSRRCS